MSIHLGDKVKDKISGYTGIATGIHKYLNGCVRITIEADKLGADGATLAGIIIDEPQVELITAAKLPEPSAYTPGPGGPRPTPARR